MNFTAHVLRFCAFTVMVAIFFQLPAGAQTIPFWESSFQFGGSTFDTRLVGTNPARGAKTTLIANTIVPMRLAFADGNSLDAQNDVKSLTASPIYVNAIFPSGTTQYADAVLRAELWGALQGSNYHVLLNSPTVAADYLLTVPATDGFTTMGEHGQITGIVDFNWFVKTVQPSVIAQLGIPPTSLTIFLTHNVRLKRPGNTCCFHGNHSAFTVRGPNGRDQFTTVWAGAGQRDVDTMSHEINEWVNDPFNDNIVPSWRIPGINDCNELLEVGDPLVGVKFKAGGYALQDVAYVEWFSRQAPSMALGGQYDFVGKFGSAAQDCKSASFSSPLR